MKAGSLFSGVGGFDLGLEAAGMEVVWQVECDEQAQSVLRHHWPDVDLHRDVCDVGKSNLARVDFIAGGFPCQDLSVAGRRAGLDGERSGLFHEFMRIVGELAPRWVLIENVPGLLSSNDGRDMGTVLGTLGDLGYGWAYRCLDTQYFGPPQRRRRVFIVGRAGGFCPPEVLLEPESLPWNPPPSREAREGAARGAAGRAGEAGGGVARPLDTTCGDYSRSDADAFVATALQARGPHRLGAMEVDGNHVVAVTGDRSHALTGEGHDASEDGTGRGTPIVAFNAYQRTTQDGVAYPIQASDGRKLEKGVMSHPPLPFDTTQITSKGNYSRPKPGDPCHPLAAGARPPSVAYALGSHAGAADADVSNKNHAAGGPTSMGISEECSHSLRGGRTQGIVYAIPRRLTPRECERLQGFPDDWTLHGMGEDRATIELADSPRYRMLGNAVSVPVAEWIGRRIIEADRLFTSQGADDAA